MPTTANKGYEVQTTGTNPNTWGDVLNDDTIAVIDENLGGITTKTLSNTPVVLTADESQTLIVRLIGTLTGAVLVTTAAVGMTIVENVTSGAFAVTFGNGVGSPVTIQQGTRAVVITDSVNGPRVAADTVSEFASGDRMVFQQTAAPTGWTKESSATYNDAALRFVTGSIGTGGSLAFSSAFTSRTIAGSVGNTTLTIDQIPAHTHNSNPLGNNNDDNSAPPAASTGGAVGATFNTTSAGGGQAHNHTFTGTALDMAVKYASCIIAQKD